MVDSCGLTNVWCYFSKHHVCPHHQGGAVGGDIPPAPAKEKAPPEKMKVPRISASGTADGQRNLSRMMGKEYPTGPQRLKFMTSIAKGVNDLSGIDIDFNDPKVEKRISKGLKDANTVSHVFQNFVQQKELKPTAEEKQRFIDGKLQFQISSISLRFGYNFISNIPKLIQTI